MSELLCKINSLALFKGIRDVEPLKSMCEFLTLADDVSQARYNVLDKYTEFVNALYDIRHDGDLSVAIWHALRYDDNAYLQAHIAKELAVIRGTKEVQISHILTAGAERELALINEIAKTSYAELEPLLAYDDYVAQFKTTGIDIRDRYLKLVKNLASGGFGMFYDHLMFRFEDGIIVPVLYPDQVTIDDLFCYDRQRGLVVNNTRAFTELKKSHNAADIILYGDEGTGKTSTVKAAARRFEEQGVRLVEIRASEIKELPALIEQLEQIPLRFIILIDDISPSAAGEDIAVLKRILADRINGTRKNILIYATCQRRHVINEISESDVRGEMLSLPEYFGLRVLFDKPTKQQYLKITHSILAKNEVVVGNEESLDKSAEQFAIKAGGRSARTARRFTDQFIT